MSISLDTWSVGALLADVLAFVEVFESLIEYKTFLSLVQEEVDDVECADGSNGLLLLLISCLRMSRSFCSDCCISNRVVRYEKQLCASGQSRNKY